MRLSISWDCLKQLLDPPRSHFFLFFERPRISPWSFCPPSCFFFWLFQETNILVHVDLICCWRSLDAPASCFPSLSSDILSTASTNPPKKKKTKKNPTLSNMRSDERWKSFPRLLKRKYKRKPTRLHLFYLIIFPLLWERKRAEGEGGKKSPPDWWGWIRAEVAWWWRDWH